MGLIFGIIKRLIKWSLQFAIFAGIIVLIPNLPPYSKFTSIELEPTQAREGPLAPNGAINNAQHLYQDKILGPEAFQILDGEVYTSLATGEIVKLSPGGHITFVTKLGFPCTGLLEEDKCGRPLDFEIDAKERKVLVADAYHGIWKVDLKTDKKQLLVSPRVEIGGRVPRLFNSVASAGKSGDFFWTHSCDFPLKDGSYCMLTDPSGRLFHYNAAKNESTVLLDGLWFANGVAVSPDQSFVVVAETARYRLLKYYVAGPKKGQSEVFVAGLPGSPDNVRALPDGSGVLVGLYTVFDEQHPLLVRSLAGTPLVRKFAARLLRLAEIPFEFLNAQFPHLLFQSVVYHIGNFRSISGLLPPMAGLVQIDWNGNVAAIYYNTDKTLGFISDAIVYKDRLYTGSPHAPYVGSVPAPEALKKAFASSSPSTSGKPKQEQPQAKVQEKRESPKVDKPKTQKPSKPTPTKPPQVKPVETPKTATPKPTTPPPKPTTPPPKTTTSAPKPTTPSSKPTMPPQKPTTPPPKSTTSPPKPTTPPTKPTTPPPKPTTPPPKPTTTQKPAENKQTTPKPQPAQSKPTKSKEERNKDVEGLKDKVPAQIPIEEVIPSDTAKPSKETLKVIKREGPAEIPNPKV